MGAISALAAASPLERRAYQAVSWALAAAFVWGLPALARAYWDDLRAAVGDDDRLTHLGTWATNVLLTLVANVGLAVVYAGRFPFFERWRISDKPWPWFSPDPAVRADFWAFLPRCVGLVLFNNFCVALPLALLVRDKLPHPPVTAAELPGTGKLLAQIAFCMAVEDAVFYWSHRLLHVRAFYPHVHKEHHKFHQPWALASEYAHPVEFLLGNIVPVIAGPRLLAHAYEATGWAHFMPHTFTIMAWMLVRIATSIDNHGGYAFPWSPVRLLPSWLGLSTDAHDFHHSRNTGLYASQFTFWDWAMGTDRTYATWLAAQVQAATSAEGAAKGGKGRKAL